MSPLSNYKVNQHQVNQIRQDRALGGTVREISAIYGISKSQVDRICRGIQRKNPTQEESRPFKPLNSLPLSRFMEKLAKKW